MSYVHIGRRVAKNDEIYAYNARSELTNATSSVDAAYRYAYDFDDIGNRETSLEREAAAVDYTVNNLNQYTSIASQSSQSTFTPTYDADGNQTLVKTKTGIWQVEYNGENRPVKWTCGATSLVMAFDRMGRRVLSEVQVEGAPVKTETYVYDGYTCILRKTTIHTNATPTVVRDTFVWDPTESVATRPLVWNRVEEKGSSRETHPTAFYFQDGNKNVSDVVSATDETKAHYTYAPFGDCTATGALAQVNPWRFSSEYTDDELACVYYNYRHYEPMTGRWLSRDPIDEEGGADLYGFCRNAPNLFDDKLGLYFGWDDAIVAGTGFLAGAAFTGISDLISGELSSWETYVGNAVAGAVFSELVYLAPAVGTVGLVGIGAFSSGVGNFVSQNCEMIQSKRGEIDWCDVEVSMALGAAIALIPVPSIRRINRGRGSCLQTAKWVHARFEKGELKSLKIRTVFKAAAGTSWNAGVVYAPMQDYLSEHGTDFVGYLMEIYSFISVEIKSETGFQYFDYKSIELYRIETLSEPSE